MSDLPATPRQRAVPPETLAGAERWLWRAIVGLLVLAGLAFLLVGAEGPADPHLAPSSGPATRAGIAGFGQTGFTVRAASGATTSLCGALADTEPQHQRGMMGRSDLAGYDAMVFRFAGDTNVQFFNKGVPIDLSIAWFDAGGRFVKGTDMPACPEADACPLFSAGAPFRYALEAPKGGLTRLGVGPGAVLTVAGACS